MRLAVSSPVDLGIAALRSMVALLLFVSFSAHAQYSTSRSVLAAADLPSLEELEARGALIGDVIFTIHDVFDTDDPKENKRIFRLANRLHIESRESAIQSQLLFKRGDRFSRQVIAETERNLRKLSYLFDASIRVVSLDGQYVNVQVETRDVWTLNPGMSFDRKGGANTWEYEIQEENLLGYGKNITFSRAKDVERSSTLIRWKDPNIWGSRWRNELTYSSNDDGSLHQVMLERPFFSLNTRWSAGTLAVQDDRIEPRYDLGKIVDEFRQEQDSYEIYGGFSRGLVNGWVRRWLAGWRYDEHRFSAAPPDRVPTLSVPTDHQLSYPWVAVEWTEDRYEQTANLNQIGRTEDLYYGRTVRLELGWAGNSLGSDRDALMFAAAGRAAFKFGQMQSLFLSSTSKGRVESGEFANAMIEGSAQYYWRWHPKRVLTVALSSTLTDNLDPENQLLLGGDNGMRGYPLRYQGGSAKALFTVEQRFYTDWYPFRLFNVGAAVFADVGRVWGASPVSSANLGLLKDIGIGLRLGNARSAFGSVVHFDIAFPLDRDAGIDSLQFLVDTKRSF